MRILVILAMLVGSTYGQSTSHVFTFAHTSTPQEFQSIANVVRTIGSIQSVSVDAQAKTLTVSGTPAQIALADWVFHNSDIDPLAQKPGTEEYTVPGAGDDVVRVFYLTPSLTPKDVQETVNLLRDIGDIRNVMPALTARAVFTRGTSAQLALAGWLVNMLQAPAAGKSQFVISGSGDTLRAGSVVRVFYLAQDKTPQAAQDLVNTVRTIADITRVYPYLASGAIAVRSNPEQIALAEWLIGMLDRPAASQPSTAAFVASGTSPPDVNAVRVFYLPQVNTPQALLQAVNTIRANAQIARIFPCAAPRAVVMRGTAAQALQAENLMTRH